MHWYAITVLFGELVYVLSCRWLPPSESHRYFGMAVILLLRLAVMRWHLRLPMFRMRSQ